MAMMISCSTCGARISTAWLFLGLPWSRYTCEQCGSVFAGTVLRFVLISIAVGVLGFVLIRVVKGWITPTALILPTGVALSLLLLRLPGQIRKVG